MARSQNLALFAAVNFLLLALPCCSGEDIFHIMKEGSPREVALERERRLWINVTKTPWSGRRVVACMTTTSTRIGLIEASLNSLLAQTRPLDVIYLFVPWVFLRDGSEYHIPAWLQSKAGITLVRCHDSGPSTHMMEVLRHERDANTYILQVDDDQVYGPELVVNLLRGSGPTPGRAIGGATQHAYTHVEGIVLEGVHGVMFVRKFFDPRVFQYTAPAGSKDPSFAWECRLHDDLWLSAHLARRGFLRDQLGSRLATTATKYGFGDDALYRGGAGSDNTRNFYVCVASLLRANPNLWSSQARVVLVAPLLSAGEGGLPGSPSHSAAKTEALEAIARFRRRLARDGSAGPHAIYTYGEVDADSPETEDPATVAPQYRIPGARLEHLGPWEATVDLVVASCRGPYTQKGASSVQSSSDIEYPACHLQLALDLALQMEEDPETLVVHFEEPIPEKGLPRLLRKHRDCHSKRSPKSRALCHFPGSSSFWRHAAYDEERTQGGIFLPSFSTSFHLSRAEGTHLPGQGDMWRDDLGPWRRAASVGQTFAQFVAHGQGGDATVSALLSQIATVKRRIVAVLQTTLPRSGSFQRLSRTLRSLLGQRPLLQRVYVFAKTGYAHAGSGRTRNGCAPGWVRAKRGVVVRCRPPTASHADVFMELLTLERWPQTLLLLADDGHQYSSRWLPHLVTAADLFPGNAIVASGYTFGDHGGPIPELGLGLLLQRTFLDTTLKDVLVDDCEDELELSLAGHLLNKGIALKSLGSTLGAKRLRGASRPWWQRLKELQACRIQILQRFPLIWTSRQPQRVALYISPLPNVTDEFVLDITIRLGALQTRKPDEVVLLALPGSYLAAAQADLPPAARGLHRSLATSELHISGGLGSRQTRVLAQDGTVLDVSLTDWLAGMMEQAGRVVRIDSSAFGMARSFVVAVAGVDPCPGIREDGAPNCAVGPTLTKGFDRELDPATVFFFTSAERLVKERVLVENLICIDACHPRCTRHNFCGQPGTRSDGAVYDLTMRRAAGYKEHVVW